MPKKSKGKLKPYRNNRTHGQSEVFRNSSAVLDDTDPHESLKYMKDIFKDKLDEDVITMIFSECAYNVDQAFETLMSLCNEENMQHHFNKCENSSKISHEDDPDSGKNGINSSFTISKTTNAYDFPKFQNKSKLAINFSSPAENSFMTPAKNQDMRANNYQHGDHQQNEHFNLDYNCVPNQSNNLLIPQNYSHTNQHSDSFNGYFSPLNYSNPRNFSTPMNVNNSASFCGGNFQNSDPRFITPLLPTPLYKYGSSPHASTNFESRNPRSWDFSRSFHESPHLRSKNTKKKCKIKEADEKIKVGSHVLVIIRGLPGSGKSSLARKLKYSGEVFSTDDFFMKEGKYVYDPFKLNEAHAWNKRRAKRALETGVTPVIIDNTHVEAWEMIPYVSMGKKYNYEIIILEPDTPWKFSVHQLSLKNTHGVPKSKLSKMKERYQHNITVENLLASMDLLDSKNIDNFSGDSEINKVVVKNDEGKIVDIIDRDAGGNDISLKAVIHQEDSNDIVLSNDASFEHNNFSLVNSSNVTDCSANLSFDHESASCFDKCELKSINSQLNECNEEISCNNSVTDQPITIHDLDELRALMREDSEDSQSLRSSKTGSSQDVSGWEDITEHDDDFLWSTFMEEKNNLSTFDNCLNLKKSYFVESQITQTSVPSSSGQNLLCKSTNSSAIDKFIEINNTTDPLVESNSIVEESFCSPKNSLPKTKLGNNLSSKCYSEKNDTCVLERNEKLDGKTAFSALKDSCVEKLWIESDSLDESGEETSELLITKPNFSSNENRLAASFEPLVISEENLSNKNDCTDLIVEPKQQRTNHDLHLDISKNCFINEKNFNFLDTENCSEWNIVEKENQEEKSVVENNAEIKISTVPKPQRKIFENTLSGFNNKINMNKSITKKSILNISIDTLDSDWSFPDYIDTNSLENQNLDETPLSMKMAMHSQTEPSDFAFVYKISEENDLLDSTKYTILCAKPYNEIVKKVSNLNLSVEDLETEICMHNVKFDKSTSTADLVDDTEISQKLAHLNECFPDISPEDLHHLLEICHNDETWLSNLLFEWGYKYNVQIENVDNNNTENLEIKDDVTCESCDSLNTFATLPNEKYPELSVEENSHFSHVERTPLASNLTDISEEMTESTTASSTTDFQKLHLVLDSAFAYQLEELFGPVVASSDSHVDKCVEIDFEFARLLHSKWKDTVNCAKSKPCSEKVKVRNIIPLKNEKKSNEASVKRNPKEPLSLSEIMDMEYALQIHKQEKLKKDVDFGTKLKRLELYNMFPGADTIALDEIFESNNYSLKNSIFAIGEDIGQKTTVQLQQKQNVEKIDERVVEWSHLTDFQEFENGDWSDWVYREDNIESVEYATIPAVSSTISSEASELRGLATKHYQLRQEFIAKAQTAYRRGMKDVASFYAQKGSEHGLLFKDINKQASALIAQQRNMSTSPLTLDLHGLYIQEAIPALEKFLRDKKLDLKRRRQTSLLTISIVTGQGLHSTQGPKLRPSVIEYLRKMGYNFSEIYCGVIEVYLTVD